MGVQVVITGTFPELGGSSGLNLGKGKAEEIVTSFGGRVVHGPVRNKCEKRQHLNARTLLSFG
jgi:hypothetical protein